jgi:hypothetical protein
MVQEIDLCCVVLNSLPEEFENLIVAWDVTGNQLGFESLRTKIINQYRAKKEKQLVGTNALLAKGGQASNSGSKDKSKQYMQRGTMNKKEKRACYVCGQGGHIPKDCTNRKYGLVAKVLGENTAWEWCLDSGASKHMTGNNNIVRNFKPNNTLDSIMIANGDQLPVIGVGTCEVRHKQGVLEFPVVVVQGLETNLFSISQYTKEGGHAVSNGNKCTLMDRQGKTSIVAEKRWGIYVMESSKEKG